MSVTVTLHVYSGRPDPSWELTDSQADELADRIAAIQQQTLAKPPGIASALGYRGFSIETAHEQRLEPHVYVHAGIVDLARFTVNLLAGDAEIETWLLATAGDAVEPDTAKFVADELAR